ncbi:hypothetical protein NQ315_012492 [Exocentrus adspersus]|uniref:Uncharacterized protein n=1 Tax=Exocentrus adspersus TaxID=1586481 RepID=A0AAV8VBI1_9CUCU|nr:hypothetical protein NQ315_012492 [Exocentrus adspersus]
MNLLPEKSRKLYESVYNTFINWRAIKKTNSFSESVLLVYFTELAAKYKPSTLWSHYSMLRSTLNINEGGNIEDYTKLRSFLKRRSEGFRPKKAYIFSSEEINKGPRTPGPYKTMHNKILLKNGG